MTKIYADGADIEGIAKLSKDPRISGFTTNPTLMRKAGIDDYRSFAHNVLAEITEHPISFEVFTDNESEMREHAEEIASWGENVYVKIPVTNSTGVPMTDLVHELSHEGIKVNVTALMTPKQTETVAKALEGGADSNISVFAGRIADTGVDPVPLMKECLEVMSGTPNAELIWASPREILNIVQADSIGCHIITVTHDLLDKLDGLGKDLDQFSLETVQMF